MFVHGNDGFGTGCFGEGAAGESYVNRGVFVKSRNLVIVTKS